LTYIIWLSGEAALKISTNNNTEGRTGKKEEQKEKDREGGRELMLGRVEEGVILAVRSW
jgi:hypothetical protein